MTPLSILRETFGYETFRPLQAEVIDHCMRGRSGLLVLPTGGGKSLCYQIPALARPGTGLVISPLIALMQDQVDALSLNGIEAAYLNSTQSAGEQEDVLRRLRAGAIDLLYVAPERAVTPRFLSAADAVEWSLIAIDEAHCISQWGHEFRPDYRDLSQLRARWPQVPCLAVTATADAPTRRDVCVQLGLRPEEVFLGGFDRPNLRYSVAAKVDARKQLVAWLVARHRGHAGIVYCGTRKRCEQVAGWLCKEGFDALPYHAGLPSEERATAQRRFLREDGVVVVATIAFGMGIDKPDVRFVVHLDAPRSLEAYYQESGRAGRDGLPSDCWMLFGWQDVVRISQMIGDLQDESGEILRHRITERRKLEQLVGWAESADCRRFGLLSYFGQTSAQRCDHCDNCADPPQTYDATLEAQMLLSCVRRTGESFGIVHLVDVLTGRQTEKVGRFGHDRLPTFGVGHEHDGAHWRSIARQLVAKGVLGVDAEGLGILRLGEDAWEILRGHRSVALKVDRAARTRRPRPVRVARATSGSVDSLTEDEKSLYDRLRALRLELAQARDVPAYVIFHDRTLREMASTRPSTLEELADVHGVGASKLDKYGEAFLRVLRATG